MGLALWKYVSWFLLGLLAVAVLSWAADHSRLSIQVKSLQDTVAKLRASEADLKFKVELVEQRNTELSASVATQNKAIESLMAEIQVKKDEARKALDKAKAELAAWKAKAAVVVTAPPSNPNDMCESVFFKLSEYSKLREQAL